MEKVIVFRDGKEIKTIVFAGARVNRRTMKRAFHYYDVDENGNWVDGVPYQFSKKLVNAGVGAIIEIPVEGDSAFYGGQAVVKGLIDDIELRAKWRAAEHAANSELHLKGQTMSDPMFEILRPLHEAYKYECNSPIQRAVLLNKILKIVVEGK